MFANAEADVTPAEIIAVKIAAVLDIIHGRSVQIGAAAHQQRHRLSDRLQRFAARLARRKFRVLRKIRDLG